LPPHPTQHRLSHPKLSPVREPSWRPEKQFTRATLPSACRQWLIDDGSLTARLVAMQQGAFRVQRLSQHWAPPLPSERALLGIRRGQVAMIREVALWVGNDVAVFARSVFPISSLGGKLGHLRRLQNKSLGAILFQHPSMHRCPFEIAKLSGDSAYIPTHLHQSSSAWGRRSRFNILGKQLLVSEVFLESFTPWDSILPLHRSQRGRVSAAFVAPTQ